MLSNLGLGVESKERGGLLQRWDANGDWTWRNGGSRDLQLGYLLHG